MHAGGGGRPWAYPDFRRKRTDERLLSGVGLDARLLLVVLDWFLVEQADEFNDALEQLARRAAGGTVAHGTGCEHVRGWIGASVDDAPEDHELDLGRQK